MAKVRLDELLVARGLAPDLQVARALIMSGDVLVRDTPCDKAGASFGADVGIRIRKNLSKFVGRGGDKLQSALDHFHLNLHSKIAIDVGSSTGGFTDCLLQAGVSKVYAVDVGHNQLAHQLRIDPRVVVMEGTHASSLTSEMFGSCPANLATVDVSFISVDRILESIVKVLARPCHLLILVKPQFELQADYVEEGGVVRNPEHQALAVKKVVDRAQVLKLGVVGVMPSALTGQKKGNQEFFLLLEAE